MKRSLPGQDHFAVRTAKLAGLLPSWQLVLIAENKSEGTIRSYTTGVRLFLRWCGVQNCTPELTKANVSAFIADLLTNGAEPATAKTRQLALKRYAAWLFAEDEIPDNPLLGLAPPKTTTKVTQSLSDDQLRLLLKACQGKRLVDRRDEAIVRLMLETGLRAGELVALSTADVDLPRGLITIRRGKGGKGRVSPFGPQTAASVDRYLRARRAHRLADTGPLWVGGGGKTFGYHGLDRTLRARALAAGIPGFHLHLMRHTAATRWLRHGGSEGGLLAIAGWTSRDMIDRYTGASAGERAAAEARTLGLGDL
jgi:site-specific recombinase XerD